MVMLDHDVSPQHRAPVINGTDDFIGFADHWEVRGAVEVDWWGLAQSFIARIELADKNKMSLKASKTLFGAPGVDF